MVDFTARAVFVGGFEEKRAAGSKSALLISIADPREHRWTPAATSCLPPLDRRVRITGLVVFRPATGKSDQP
jgi:hypothetical protein